MGRGVKRVVETKAERGGGGGGGGEDWRLAMSIWREGVREWGKGGTRGQEAKA
jgi:hypothetical protein